MGYIQLFFGSTICYTISNLGVYGGLSTFCILLSPFDGPPDRTFLEKSQLRCGRSGGLSSITSNTIIMGKLTSGLSFTGSLSNLSAYKMRGAWWDDCKNEKVDLPKKRLRTRLPLLSPATWIMFGMHPHKLLADYNIAGPLQATDEFLRTVVGRTLSSLSLIFYLLTPDSW